MRNEEWIESSRSQKAMAITRKRKELALALLVQLGFMALLFAACMVFIKL